MIRRLLEITSAIEKLTNKLLEPKKEDQELLFHLLEEYYEKEKSILTNLKEDEEKKLKTILYEVYGLDPNGILIIERIKKNYLPPCVLRIYNILQDQEYFYSIQKFTALKREETNEIIGNNYILELQRRENFRKDFYRIVLENFYSLKQEDKKEILFYLGENKESLKEQLKKEGTTSLEIEGQEKDLEELFPDIILNIKQILEEIKKENEAKKIISYVILLKSYFITLGHSYSKEALSYSQNILQKIETEEPRKMNILKKVIEEENITINKGIKKNYFPSKMTYLPIFTKEEFQEFHQIFEELLEIGFEIWSFYKTLVMSKLKEEKEEDRKVWKKELEHRLEKEKEIINNIEKKNLFANFVTFLYSESLQLIPFYAIQVAMASKNYQSLNDMELVKDLIKERAIKIICEEKDELENLEFLDDDLRLTRLEDVVKEHIKVREGKIQLDEFYDQLDILDFGGGIIPEDIVDEGKEIIFENFMILLEEYLKNHKNSPCYEELFLSLYCIHFYEQDLNSFIKRDLDYSYGNTLSNVTLESEAYEMLQEEIEIYLEDNLTEKESWSKPEDILFQLYLKALRKILKREDWQEIKRMYTIEILELKKNKP